MSSHITGGKRSFGVGLRVSLPDAIVTNPHLVYPRKATPQNSPHMISIDPALMAPAALPVVEPEYDYEGPDFTPEPDGSGLAGF